jgi:hypothetical protein
MANMAMARFVRRSKVKPDMGGDAFYDAGSTANCARK